jgi:hypothetical protein
MGRFTIPPCPDPARYVLVKTREGNFWRLKRGLGEKGAELNSSYAKSADAMSVTAPAAKQLVNKLRPYLDRMVTGRITVNFSALLRKAFNRNGTLGYENFMGYDFQREYPMDKLLTGGFEVKNQKDEVEILIPIEEYTVKQHGQLVTHYFFELIMLSGDCSVEHSVRIESESSDVFTINSKKDGGCRLSLPIVRKPWFAVLKVSCIEGNEMAMSPRNYGMKVVAVG